MRIQIPEELKKDVPLSNWGKILTATPVIMTVVSTMLAGLASSEMTRAQYSRSSAAQQQAKAGDQWGFFFGMLGAQAAVIVSTFSLAARHRSMLWTMATVAGLAAIVFAIYVYFFVQTMGPPPLHPGLSG